VRTKLRQERDELAARVERLEAALRTISGLAKYYPEISAEKIMSDMIKVARKALKDGEDG